MKRVFTSFAIEDERLRDLFIGCIEPLFPGQFRCLKLVGLSFYRVTVLDFLSRPIPVFFCPTNHAF
jgi:hypothetical protein